ncbi:MAG: DUF4339 domain-containing protein [Planctomycetaceae bacterium]
MADWYVKRGGKVRGPFTTEKLKSYAESGRLRREDLVGKTKAGPFRMAGDLAGLFSSSTEEDQDEDFGFPALSGIDLHAGEAIYEASDSDEYTDDEDDYYKKPKRQTTARRTRKSTNDTIYYAGVMLIGYSAVSLLVTAFTFLNTYLRSRAAAAVILESMGQSPTEKIIYHSIAASIAGLTILAGVFMIRKRYRYFIMLIAILNMIPMINCCFVTAMPMAIWVLIVLNLHDVKVEFE